MPESAQMRRYRWLSSALEKENAVVLTASRRLARELRISHSKRQLEAGKTVWPTPAIDFVGDWATRQLETVATPGVGRVLSSSATALLWERIVSRHADDSLLGSTALARLAASTWRIVLDWCVPLEAIVRSARTRDERVFAASADEYRRALQAEDWLDEASVVTTVLTLLERKEVRPTGPVTLVGFDHLPPVYAALVDRLRDAGIDTVVLRAASTGESQAVASLAVEAAGQRAARRGGADRFWLAPPSDV
ncbi:MAG: hypothetical protein AAGA61_09690, partial [Pseudomonadota bacterium]